MRLQDITSTALKTHIFGRPTLFVRGAEALRFVLTNENKYFTNSLPTTIKALLGDRSLSLQMGAMHIQRRKLLYQAFQARILERYISNMENITQQYLQKWATLESLTWYPELRSYTFDLACHFLIGLEKASDPLRDLFEVWSAGLFSVPLSLPWTCLVRPKTVISVSRRNYSATSASRKCASRCASITAPGL